MGSASRLSTRIRLIRMPIVTHIPATHTLIRIVLIRTRMRIRMSAIGAAITAVTIARTRIGIAATTRAATGIGAGTVTAAATAIGMVIAVDTALAAPQEGLRADSPDVAAATVAADDSLLTYFHYHEREIVMLFGMSDPSLQFLRDLR